MRSGDATVAQVERQSIAINLRFETGMCAERLQLRTKQEDTAHPSVIQRFFAQTVATEVENALLAVPKAKGKHAVHTSKGSLHIPAVEARQQHFGIRVT